MTGIPSVQHFLDQRLTIELDDRQLTLQILDWAALQRISEDLAARADGLSPGEVGELYNRYQDPANDIYEYFLYDHDEQVVSQQWWPFAVLGLGYGAESFAEIDHDGLLVFDLERAEGGRAPVLWVRDHEVRELATGLDDLPIRPAG